MLVVLTTGRFLILKCPACNTTFTGPRAREYLVAHYPRAGAP